MSVTLYIVTKVEADPQTKDAEPWDDEFRLSDRTGTSYKSKLSVHLDGRCEKRRYLVRVEGKDRWVSERSFEVLLKLGLAAHKTALGWMGSDQLGITGNYHMVVLRVKQDLQGDGVDVENLIENNRIKQYRLSTPPTNITFDFPMIRQHFAEAAQILGVAETKRSETA